MKTLLWVLGVLLLVVMLFVLIGVVSPGQESVTKVSIYAPIEHTWRIYHDQSLLKEWVPGLSDIQLTTEEAATVGAEYELTLTDPSGKQSTMHEKITAFDKPNRFAMDYANDMLTGNTEVLFETVGDSTVVTALNRYTGSSIFLKSMFHFFSGNISKQTQNQYNDLKALVESIYLNNPDLIEIRDLSPQSDSIH